MRARPFLLLLALALLPYLPGLFNGFVYDDHGAIVENQLLTAPDAWSRVLTLRTFFEPRTLDGTRPTLLVSILLDHALGARDAWRYRIANLLLHAGCVLLLFTWLRGVLQRAGDRGASARAFIAAMIFALHPLASEAVQLPSFREDPLALFWMLVVFALSPWRAARWRAPLQGVAFLFALGAKEYAAVLPALAAALWWLFPAERPSARRGAWELGAGVALTAAVMGLGVVAHPPQAWAGAWNGLSLRPPENVWTAPWIFLRYLKLLIAPWPLSVDRIVSAVAKPASAAFVIGLFSVLAVAALAIVARRRQPLFAFGLAWMLIAFLPISNLVPLHNPIADRYAYSLIAGFALLVAALPLEDRVIRRGILALAVVYVLLLELRLPNFYSDDTLWGATVRAEPRSARANVGLGLASLRHGIPEDAAEYFRRADALNPRDVTALINLAVLDARTGSLDAASAKLEEALARRPDKSEAWATLALVREQQGRREEAIEATEKARALDPLGRYQ
ncbi:MAG: tetratricopeptide repeat protein [Kiritimatiellae bacterium]|nr:tetratricopeptide repeat protein [Kiritimatiellia bacterium]